MRWPIFFIFAYLILGAQIGVGDNLRIADATANLVLLGTVFICLNAPRETALTAAFLLGLCQDLLSAQAPGLFAVSYGLVGLLCASSSRAVYSDHPFTHVIVGFIGQAITVGVILLHSYLRPPMGMAHLPVWPLAASCMYTAAVAPFVMGVLVRIKSVFGFQRSSRHIRPY